VVARRVLYEGRTGGKSEFRRARRSVTRSPGNGKESATERETTRLGGKG
jgi:hypothetical protein